MQNSQIKTLIIAFLVTLLFSSNSSLLAQHNIKPQDAIVIKDYAWKSGGRGLPAILREITLENTSSKDFRNIEIEIELYTKDHIPQGSLRGIIKDTLPAGSEKTFRDIKLGIMNSELQNSTARIVRAEEIEKGTPTHPRHLLLVKDWKITANKFGTEAILDEITIENRSKKNFKDIKIKIGNLGVKSGPKVGPEGYTSIVTIHDFIEAKTTKTFRDINIGFSHPETKRHYVYVVDAKPLSNKELRYMLAKDNKLKRFKKKTDADDVTKDQNKKKEEHKLTLAERYRKELQEKQKEQTQDLKTKVDDTTESNKTKRDALKDTYVEKTSTARSEKFSDIKTHSKKESTHPIEETEEEVPLPKYDIVVESFRWGSGIPGTVGTIETLVLKNISNIDYGKIHLVVEFFSPTGIPLASNDLRINEILPAGKERTFKNLKVGLIQVLPDERNIKIRVKDAEAYFKE